MIAKRALLKLLLAWAFEVLRSWLAFPFPGFGSIYLLSIFRFYSVYFLYFKHEIDRFPRRAPSAALSSLKPSFPIMSSKRRPSPIAAPEPEREPSVSSPTNGPDSPMFDLSERGAANDFRTPKMLFPMSVNQELLARDLCADCRLALPCAQPIPCGSSQEAVDACRVAGEHQGCLVRTYHEGAVWQMCMHCRVATEVKSWAERIRDLFERSLKRSERSLERSSERSSERPLKRSERSSERGRLKRSSKRV